jgi:protein-S-isoprenylcysteine O-methyltransferase Ste14
MPTTAVAARLFSAIAPEPRALAALPCNLAVAALYVVLAVSHVDVARRTGQWATTAPLVLQEAILVVLFLVRRPSLAISRRALDWLVAIAGSLLPLAMRPTDPPGALAGPGSVLQILGILAAIAAALSLGTSIGIVAGNRGIRTTGLYRWVRHPMYGAYLVCYLGYVIAFPSAANLGLAAATTAALALRVGTEERFLAADPVYRAYRARTRFRLVPGLY